ncbi:MAG: 4Fe-4S dicluster domain-containing protein [Pseudomonadota bacterium]|nr:4Fe-4S dicluster domain-containing protein [Pseudomonadota bacterium]
MHPIVTASGTFNPEQITRVVFQDFSPSTIRFFYVIGYLAIGLFLWNSFIEIRKYMRGKKNGSFKISCLVAGVKYMFSVLLTHRTLRRRDTLTGWMHAMIFFGFSVLLAGTSIITLQYDITAPLFGFKFWYGYFYLWFLLLMNIAGSAFITGLLYMMYRRNWLKPPKLDYTRPDREPNEYDRSSYRHEDWVFLWVMVTIGITGFLLAATRIIWLHDDPTVWGLRWWQPISTVIAYTLMHLGVNSNLAHILRNDLWWFHGLLALTFIALIPRTKAKHILTSAISLIFKDPMAAQRLPRSNPDEVSIGYSEITDFTWKHLLNLDACTKCGRCHEACPARATGAPLSPRDVILSLREFANRTMESQTLPNKAELSVHGKAVDQVFMETLWSCRTCMACVEICPVAIEHVPIIVQMRRKLVEDGDMDPILQKTLQTIHKSGNSFGESKRKRASWVKKLPFEIKDARNEDVDVAWFVGDYASFDPRNQKVTQSFARILKLLNIDFGLFFEGESNAGNDVRRVGEEGLYELLAENNIEMLRKSHFKRIITTDPHSYNTIRNEYPDFGGKFEIEHYTSYLARIIGWNQLTPTRKLNYTVTFHDPCHLGRFNKNYEAPREIIRALGLNLVEMERTRDNSFCCGAGGGRIWIPDVVGMEKPSQNRIREAAKIKDLEIFVVCCPKDLVMFEDAIKTSGHEGHFVVKELIELIAEAIELPTLETAVS